MKIQEEYVQIIYLPLEFLAKYGLEVRDGDQLKCEVMNHPEGEGLCIAVRVAGMREREETDGEENDPASSRPDDGR